MVVMIKNPPEKQAPKKNGLEELRDDRYPKSLPAIVKPIEPKNIPIAIMGPRILFPHSLYIKLWFWIVSNKVELIRMLWPMNPWTE
jgi:hypothetical protein